MLRATVALSFLVLVFVLFRIGQHFRGASPITGAGSDIYEMHIVDTQKGAGLKVEKGSKVQVNYRAWVYDPQKSDRHGEEIDSSYKREKPMEMTIGMGQMIPAFDEGLLGLKEGGKRIIFSPSAKAYGTAGVTGVIPGQHAIIYEVELLKILSATTE